jgi:hypothetical protein
VGGFRKMDENLKQITEKERIKIFLKIMKIQDVFKMFEKIQE